MKLTHFFLVNYVMAGNFVSLIVVISVLRTEPHIKSQSMNIC